MTDVFDRLREALKDRYRIERELGARLKTISDGQGRSRVINVFDRLGPSSTVSL